MHTQLTAGFPFSWESPLQAERIDRATLGGFKNDRNRTKQGPHRLKLRQDEATGWTGLHAAAFLNTKAVAELLVAKAAFPSWGSPLQAKRIDRATLGPFKTIELSLNGACLPMG